jgi:hypothetical protein
MGKEGSPFLWIDGLIIPKCPGKRTRALQIIAEIMRFFMDRFLNEKDDFSGRNTWRRH